jgi:hypothetical protein
MEEDTAANALLQLSSAAKHGHNDCDIADPSRKLRKERKNVARTLSLRRRINQMKIDLPPTLRQRLDHMTAAVLAFREKQIPMQYNQLLRYDKEYRELVRDGEKLQKELNHWLERHGKDVAVPATNCQTY